MKADGTQEAGKNTATTNSKPQSVAKKSDSIGAMIERLKPQLEKALPKHVTTERLARVALTAVRNNPKLGQADALSLMWSIMQAAQLGLEPNTPLGQCYIIPYENRKLGRVDAQFQMGYKGIVDLAHRTGQYRRLTAMAVDEADTFEYSYGLNPKLIHDPSKTPTGNTVFFYAQYELTNGGYDFRVWSRDKVEKHAKQYSKSFASGPWQTNFDQMACKTVMIDLLRYAPKSVEIATAASADNRAYRINPDDPELNLDTIDGDYEVAAE